MSAQRTSSSTKARGAVAERAAAAHVPVRLEEWSGMFHSWHAYAGTLHGADEAIAVIGGWTRAWLDRSS